MKDQWDCVLDDPEELGDQEFIVLMDQYSTEIFSFLLLFLPCCSSTFRQTNVESAQIRSEDNFLILQNSIAPSSLEVDHHDEEEYSVVLTLGKRYPKKFLALHQSKIFHRSVQFLWMGWQEYVFVVLL